MFVKMKYNSGNLQGVPFVINNIPRLISTTSTISTTARTAERKWRWRMSDLFLLFIRCYLTILTITTFVWKVKALLNEYDYSTEAKNYNFCPNCGAKMEEENR